MQQLQNEAHCMIQAMINFCPNITQISTRKAYKAIKHLKEPSQTLLKCPMWHQKHRRLTHGIRGHIQSEENSKQETQKSLGANDLSDDEHMMVKSKPATNTCEQRRHLKPILGFHMTS